MKNPDKITIEKLAECYSPQIWDSCDHIVNSNITDQTIGYYAYLLQEELGGKEVLDALQNDSVLITIFTG